MTRPAGERRSSCAPVAAVARPIDVAHRMDAMVAAPRSKAGG